MVSCFFAVEIFDYLLQHGNFVCCVLPARHFWESATTIVLSTCLGFKSGQTNFAAGQISAVFYGIAVSAIKSKIFAMSATIVWHGDSLASSSHEVSLEPIFKRREDLGKHSVKTHFPKDRNCEICKRTKITRVTRAPCRRRNGEAVPRAVNFGDLIKADHKVLSDNCESRNNHRYAIVVQDLATQWIQSYP